VYGLGLSGRAAARVLLARDVSVVAVDVRPADRLDLTGLEPTLKSTLEVLAGAEPEALPAGRIDAVVVSPGVPMDRPLLEDARAKGVPVIAEVELAYPLVQGIVTFKPRAAALLNISEDHLDRYGTLEAYIAAKKRLFRDMDAEGIAVLNADDPEADDAETLARKRWFSRRGPVRDGCWATPDGRVLEVVPGEPDTLLFHADDVPLAGVQNLENAMASALLARAIGAEPAEIRTGLLGFQGLPHRMQRIGERNGVVFYDDSKGTNPGAVLKSLEGFPGGTVHLILGGRNKDADLSVLTPLVREKARRVYLIGESAGDFEAALGGVVPVERSETLDRAVRSAAAEARPGEAVVLSPACASFDQFRNFVHRGEVFQSIVREILGGPDGEEARG
jgi:UDP-N-acetylmuramoylalanine--D-glutamate ligase